MAYKGVDLNNLVASLGAYLQQHRQTLSTAFSTYAQRFEAYCFMHEVQRLNSANLNPQLRNPGNGNRVVLKFNTRGKPSRYSFCEFSIRGETIELRHNLKVRSAHAGPLGLHNPEPGFYLDLSFIRANSIVADDWVEAHNLFTFAECKHMPAFPELIAGFLGMVHEVMPRYVLSPRRATGFTRRALRPPTLMTSQFPTVGARTVWATVAARGLCLRLLRYDRTSGGLIDET